MTTELKALLTAAVLLSMTFAIGLLIILAKAWRGLADLVGREPVSVSDGYALAAVVCTVVAGFAVAAVTPRGRDESLLVLKSRRRAMTLKEITKRLEAEGKVVRQPVHDQCPSCFAKPDEWCRPGCVAIDLADYR